MKKAPSEVSRRQEKAERWRGYAAISPLRYGRDDETMKPQNANGLRMLKVARVGELRWLRVRRLYLTDIHKKLKAHATQ